MKTKILLYHHLGLGDHLICNGLVRYFGSEFNKVYILVKKSNFATVYFLYLHDVKYELILVEDDKEATKIFNSFNGEKIKIGFNYLENSKKNFDEAFYEQVGIEFNIRFKGFFVKRDYSRESQLFTRFGLPNKYIFIHDDKTRNLEIDEKKILTHGLPIVRPDKKLTSNLFDWLKIIENAVEIHCMDSSFKLMIDSVYEEFENLFYHIRLKNNVKRDVTKSKLTWKIID